MYGLPKADRVYDLDLVLFTPFQMGSLQAGGGGQVWGDGKASEANRSQECQELNNWYFQVGLSLQQAHSQIPSSQFDVV